MNNIPHPQNKRVLNKAWAKVCKRAIINEPLERKNKIILICLIVEKATIFFKSISNTPKIPPNKKVKILKTKSKLKIKFNLKKSFNLKKIKIPAVTKVEEWTIAEIGVGADIAAGSQEEKGNWALLVKRHKKKIKITKNEFKVEKLKKILLWNKKKQKKN